jgi:hypothetical protein
LLRPGSLLDEMVRGPAGTVLLRRKNYSQIWIHQFMRAKVLRHLFESFPEEISHARAMDYLKNRVALPTDHRLYVVERNLAVFGESTMGGRVTRNCGSSLRALGMDVPAGFEEMDVEVVMGAI